MRIDISRMKIAELPVLSSLNGYINRIKSHVYFIVV